MFSKIWLLLITIIFIFFSIWALDSDGFVLIEWLGYRVRTDIFAAILISIFFTLLIFFVSYVLVKILSFKFPNLLKIFSEKRHMKKLEINIKKQEKIQSEFYDISLEISKSLEEKNYQEAESLTKKLLISFLEDVCFFLKILTYIYPICGLLITLEPTEARFGI